jgi:hypothetical protein
MERQAWPRRGPRVAAAAADDVQGTDADGACRWCGGGDGRRFADSASLVHATWDVRCVVEPAHGAVQSVLSACGGACGKKQSFPCAGVGARSARADSPR